jgi:hypothetical protein
MHPVRCQRHADHRRDCRHCRRHTSWVSDGPSLLADPDTRSPMVGLQGREQKATNCPGAECAFRVPAGLSSSCHGRSPRGCRWTGLERRRRQSRRRVHVGRDLVSASTAPDRRLCIALRSGHEMRLKTKRKDAPAMVALLAPYCHGIVPLAPPAFDAHPVPLGFGCAPMVAADVRQPGQQLWSAAASPLPPSAWMPPPPPAKVTVPGT